MATFLEKVTGALYGTAIGDAMGAPVEGQMPEKIRERFADHDFRTFIPHPRTPDPGTGKGCGRITDDTLMVEVLIRAYERAGDHMDAYGYAAFMLPLIKGEPVWVPERAMEMDLWDRLWFPEKYPWLRLAVGNADPRSAGTGNCVNCGVAMWMLPVGAVNAGDPSAAYQEGAAIGLAHNESFAVEAGAVMAAASAAAFAADGTIESVLNSAGEFARDGTRGAVRAAIDAADPDRDLGSFIADVRRAVAPYDQREGHAADDKPLQTRGVSDVGRPSRTASIEEFPVACACLKYGAGDCLKTLRAGVMYGRDCDSIAGMACGLYGALYGGGALPSGLRSAVEAANRRDFASLAASFEKTIRSVHEKDLVRFDARRRAIGSR